MRSYIIMAIALTVLLLGCVNPPQQANNTTYTPPAINAPNASPAQNVTPSQNTTVQPLPPNYTVSLGDYASVLYALYVDGALYDTNNATLANESGTYNPARKYQPFSFSVEFNKGVIDGFVINVIGMRVNETIAFSVNPERGYGPYDLKKVMVLPRYYQKNLFETVPRSYFEERDINVSNGTSFSTTYGTVFVQDFNDENVTLYYYLKDYFVMDGLPQRVANTTIVNMTNNYTANIEFMLDVNKTYVLPDPNTGQKTIFKVIEKTDQNITLDANHALANKTLTFVVTLLNVTRPAQ